MLTNTSIGEAYRPALVLIEFTDGSFEFREVDKDFKLGPATQISDSFLKSVIERVNTDDLKEETISFYGKSDSRVLAFRGGKRPMIAWKCKAGPRKILHTNKKYEGVYNFPDLVFKMTRSSMSVWALKGRSLYSTNFPNVSTGVCLGSVNLRWKSEMTFEEAINMGEASFFDTDFSHGIEHTQFKTMKGENGFFDWDKAKKQWNVKNFIKKATSS